jgi:hypothetical protein
MIEGSDPEPRSIQEGRRASRRDPLWSKPMTKMNHSRPSFRSPGKVYESINGSDLPREFWGNPRSGKHTSKAELRREADEAKRDFDLKTQHPNPNK